LNPVRLVTSNDLSEGGVSRPPHQSWRNQLDVPDGRVPARIDTWSLTSLQFD